MKLHALSLLALLSLGYGLNAELKLANVVFGSAQCAIGVYALLRAKDHYSKTEGVKGAAHDVAHKVEGKVDEAKNGPSLFKTINYKRHSWQAIAWGALGLALTCWGVNNLWHCNPSHS